MRFIAALLALVAFSAHAETKTVTWVNATKNVDQSPIVATGQGSLVRTIVEYGTKTAAGAFGTKQGEVLVAAPSTTLQLSLVVVQEYALRAFHCNTYAVTFAVNAPGCSGFSSIALTTVAPPTPEAPSNITVTSTRIGSAEFECLSGAGAVISRHTRQDKAEESCINQALANLGTAFEVRPSGYRWIAQAR